MGKKLTDRVNQIILNAAEEARLLKHAYMGPEHILLGVAKETSGIGGMVLRNHGLDLEKLRNMVKKVPQKALDETGPKKTKKFPQSPAALKIFNYAEEIAGALKHDYVGTEHVLLALLADKETQVYVLIQMLGANPAELRRETLSFMGFIEIPDFNAWVNDRVKGISAVLEQVVAEIEAEAKKHRPDQATPEQIAKELFGGWRDMGARCLANGQSNLSTLMERMRPKDEHYQICHCVLQPAVTGKSEEMLILTVKNAKGGIELREIPSKFLPQDKPFASWDWPNTDLDIKISVPTGHRAPLFSPRPQ